MLSRDNSALWTLMAVQNLTGPRPISPPSSTSTSTSFSSAAGVAAAVGAATITMAAVDQYMQRLKSCKEAVLEGVQVQAADLSAYLSVIVTSLILCLAWLAAQNIALAMTLAVHIVPATCIIAAAGYRLGLIHLYYKLSPPPVPVPVPVSVSAIKKTEERGNDMMTSNSKPYDETINSVTLNKADADTLRASGETHSYLPSVKGVGEDVILDSDSDKTGDSVTAMTSEGETSISTLSSDTVCGLISAAPSQTMKTLCRCVLLLLLLLGSPAVVPAVVFGYKAIFISHPHAQTLTSATYFASLANDWAHSEVPQLLMQLNVIHPSIYLSFLFICLLLLLSFKH